MAYKVIILYRLYMPSYFLGTFTEYPKEGRQKPRLGFLPPLSFILYEDYCLVATLTFSSISQ